LPNQRSWYEIRAENAVKGATDVLLYDAIGGFGITAQAFVEALNAVKTKQINLYVNSPGGAVDEGTAIYNALDRHPATVNATVDGMAASAASFIVQAADKITMGAGSLMMIHDPYAMAIGNVETMAKMSEYLNAAGDSIAGIYAKKAGGTPEEWRSRMKEEIWYKAEEAVAAGLADEVASASAAAALAGRAFNLAEFPFTNVPDWVPSAPPDVEATPDPAPTPHDDDHGWPLMGHHTPDGAVDHSRLHVALRRASNLDIQVTDRDKALHHLREHAQAAAWAA
jgi:ATP-dependent protease ClpP protease subunit